MKKNIFDFGFFIVICALYAFLIIGIAQLTDFTDKKTRITKTVSNPNENDSLILDPNLNLTIPSNNTMNYDLAISLFGCNLIACLEIKSNFPIGVDLLNYISYKNATIGVILKTIDAIWVVFRGTQNVNEWTQNLLIQQVPHSENFNGQKHKGFLDIYLSLNIVDFLNELQPQNLYICGHSLGGALSLLLMSDSKLLITNKACYLFGTPRVGNATFANELIGQSVFRIVNRADIVNELPPCVSPNFIGNPNDVFIYQHIEKELISFEDNRNSFNQNHALKTYLHFLQN